MRIIFAHRYPNCTHHHMNHHRPHCYLHRHRHHHHNQIVCTSLCTFLSMRILTNAAIAWTLHARAHLMVKNSPSSETGKPKVCIATTMLPLSESASTLSKEYYSVTRTAIPRHPYPATPSSLSSLSSSSSRPTIVVIEHGARGCHQYPPHCDACVQQRQHCAVDRAPQDQPVGLHYLTTTCIMHWGNS